MVASERKYVNMAITKDRTGILESQLGYLMSCMTTVKLKNTADWMNYIVGVINKVAEAIGDEDRCALNEDKSGLVIVKGAGKGAV